MCQNGTEPQAILRPLGAKTFFDSFHPILHGKKILRTGFQNRTGMFSNVLFSVNRNYLNYYIIVLFPINWSYFISRCENSCNQVFFSKNVQTQLHSTLQIYSKVFNLKVYGPVTNSPGTNNHLSEDRCRPLLYATLLLVKVEGTNKLRGDSTVSPHPKVWARGQSYDR